MIKMPNEIYENVTTQMVTEILTGKKIIKWTNICQQYILPDDLLQHIINNVPHNKMKNKWYNITLQIIAKNQVIPKILDKYKGKLYWACIIESPQLTDSLVLRYLKQFKNWADMLVEECHESLSDQTILALQPTWPMYRDKLKLDFMPPTHMCDLINRLKKLGLLK